MTTAKTEAKGLRFPLFEGLLPIKASQVPTEVIAGITLAALATGAAIVWINALADFPPESFEFRAFSCKHTTWVSREKVLPE